MLFFQVGFSVPFVRSVPFFGSIGVALGFTSLVLLFSLFLVCSRRWYLNRFPSVHCGCVITRIDWLERSGVFPLSLCLLNKALVGLSLMSYFQFDYRVIIFHLFVPVICWSSRALEYLFILLILMCFILLWVFCRLIG